MPHSARIELTRLHCYAEWDADGHSEPYVWTLFFWIDAVTATDWLERSGEPIGTFAPLANETGRGLITGGVRAGDNRDLPAALREHTHYFPDPHPVIADRFGAIVALLEHDDTPSDAIVAGHRTFASSVHRELNDFVKEEAREPTDAEIEAIQGRIASRVRAAVKDKLSTWSKLFGQQDDFFGGGFASFSPLEPQSFSMRMTTTEDRWVPGLGGFGRWVSEPQDYEVWGELEVTEVPAPVPDPCQRQVDAVRQARELVQKIMDQIRALQRRIAAAPPEDRFELMAALRSLRTEKLNPALSALSEAQLQLLGCRFSTGQPPRPSAS